MKLESECSNHDVDDNMKETCGSPWSDPSTQQQNVGDNCAASDFKAPISDHPFVDPILECYSDDQIRNYNELLKQYYELEQRKEKIAEQLWSANYWNYQNPAQCSPSQEQQVPHTLCGVCLLPTTDMLFWVSNPARNRRFSILPSRSHVFINAFSMNSIKHSAQEIGGTVETGIMPIEMVTNPIEENLSGKFNLSEEKKGEHDVSSTSKCPRTDLTSVLNAWYWAGFKTGRYLLEQEQADKLNKQG